MKILSSLCLLMIVFSSCRNAYVEVYHIERHPVIWCETICTKGEHYHYKTKNDEWECLEIPADTFDIILNDTIVEKTYMGTYKKKEYKIKWDIKNFEKQ